MFHTFTSTDEENQMLTRNNLDVMVKAPNTCEREARTGNLFGNGGGGKGKNDFFCKSDSTSLFRMEPIRK